MVPDNLLMDGAAPPRPDQAVRETAALMHDIGKVKTPNEILNKPDKLTGARRRCRPLRPSLPSKITSGSTAPATLME